MNEAPPVEGLPEPPDKPAGPSANEYDLAGGTVALEVNRRIDEELKENTARRKLRNAAFWGFGAVCMFFLAVLLLAAGMLLLSPMHLAIIAHSKDWHYLTVLLACIVTLGAVPLSLSVALIKMVSHAKQEEPSLDITTPQIEMLKMLVNLIRGP